MASGRLEGQPFDGVIPPHALATVNKRPLGFYVHVPFCATRCGYCDFNTYTAEELGGGSSRASWRESAIAEVELAAKSLGSDVPEVSRIFIGGGTPTLLPAEDLIAVVNAIENRFGLSQSCEITTEANPDSVTASMLSELRSAGFNRISFGMQSAVPHVLKVLERTHGATTAIDAARMAAAAGFNNINVDLIYGTPGESVEDLRHTLSTLDFTVISHVSAYALIVEEGTRLARAIARGEIKPPDDDDLADKYEVIDSFLETHGLSWYEVSNWSKPGAECQHNLGYWQSDNWWGIGPGAHSHVGGVRWWNHKHPAQWTQQLIAGASPAQAAEFLTEADAHVEAVLLGMRLATGIDAADVKATDLEALIIDGLVERRGNKVVLTFRGRLLADAVVHRVLA